MDAPRYAELQATSHYSFLRGASSPNELFATASLMGIEAMAVVDRNSLAGIVRAKVAAEVTGIRLVVGCRLDLADALPVLVYPTTRAAYGRLCRLLTLGKSRTGKGRCILFWSDLAASREGLLAVLVPDEADERLAGELARLADAFGDRAYMALTLRRRPNDQLRLHELSGLALAAGVRTVVTNDVLYHEPGRRILQDVVTCIRHGVTIDEAGFLRERHADRYLKPPAEMHRLFARYPDALARTREIVARCRFSLNELEYQYPEERRHPELSPQETLRKLAFEGARWRYGENVPDKVIRALRHELDLIEKMDYPRYFLTVDSIVRFARSQGILCQGRGSAANSAVCFCLGITSIDPTVHDLLFERFVSENRNEPPDIDVDFEHERREEVIQWVYDTYGRERAALCSVAVTYRPRGALRDVGRVLGLPPDLLQALSRSVWSWSEGIEEKHAAGLNLNLGDRRLRLALELAEQLIGTPRHLSQHPGGFVLTRDRLDDLVPIEPAAMADRQVIEWDKDDIDHLNFMKVDVLGLGMLSVLRRALAMIGQHKNEALTLASIPQGDEPTYAMITRADTVGTFQIESRAQMSMLPRMKPRELYDLVIQVAIVRPGPIQGDMVHPYLRRREGKETPEYPKPELEAVLGKTLGVPLFQEQAMRVAIDCAGFTANEADELRRAMATFKLTGGVSRFRDKLVQGMIGNGYERDFAERMFRQLEGFGSYGFPESHAASFALLAYASAWIKCHHPDVFCAALLNSQPMGFYAPAQIVRDAEAHGIVVRPVCVNRSDWDCTLEPMGDDHAVRLGLRMVKGLARAQADRLVAARGSGAFGSIEDLWRRAGTPADALRELADADAFRDGLGLSRREAIWVTRALADEPLPLFAAAAKAAARDVPEIWEAPPLLLPMPEGGEVVADYGHVGLSLRAHPLAFLRADLKRRRMVTCAEAMAARDGAWVEVAGLALLRQRPGSAKGTMFMTLEDETATANLVIWPKVFEANRRAILGSHLVSARGRIQRQGPVVHLVVRRLADLSDALSSVSARGRAGDALAPPSNASGLRMKTRDFR
ncbi:error-prone DNA polymerase [Aureimonas jatrophae]|uniref:Error-prone DNA polymerase n=1 Tax=Aureimonas jatrophae TaxID=1166073 RepID=A0A1H0DKL1_9HYPH|nr:error-prone DNA polymerase [Aureimonas jatrophae]MBB3951940.1 error-prone DNA polymerase [Aureimonas jatrophae]SDN70541.1 error-prone DNA polymerase [Aureimonas jatrophae]